MIYVMISNRDRLTRLQHVSKVVVIVSRTRSEEQASPLFQNVRNQA